MSDFLRLFMMPFKYGPILLRYYSTVITILLLPCYLVLCFTFITNTFISDIIVTQKLFTVTDLILNIS